MPARALAQFIQQGLNDQKHPETLNLSNHKITHIGILNSQSASLIHHLNLKNNHLKSIDGIAQFTSLQSLDLSHNKITSIQSLFQLKNLFHLKRLYLKGNPFLQNPLTEQILTFLGGFQNDIEILNFVFINQSRQALINQHKRSKSHTKSWISKLSANSKISQHSKISDQSKRSDKSQTKKQQTIRQIRRQAQIASPRSLEVSKYVQINKANILLRNMKEFIEEGHESQEISSQSIHPEKNHQESIFIEDNPTFQEGFKQSEITPMKKSPKFKSFAAQDKTFEEKNQTTKFQEESTGLKGRSLNKSKINQLDDIFCSNQQSEMVLTQEKFNTLKSPTNQSLSQDFRKSQSKQFKYQVDNMKIKMEMESINMNCPSIIEKEDHDSYEIQFDFMSPERVSNKIPTSPKVSPSKQFKQVPSSYMRIQQAEITLNANGNRKTNKQPLSKQLKTPKIQSFKTPSNTLSDLLSRKQQKQSKSVSKKVQKQNLIQNFYHPTPQPILSKKGSLYQSTKNLVPQTNKSNANDLISKLLIGKHKHPNQNDSISFSVSPSLQEMIENGQKFDKFYYNSLTKLKPVFNLLYSPFSSLKTDEKDLLLQELFKNHKQIFILFIRQYHTKQQLQDEIRFKNQQIDSQHQEILQLNYKIQFLGDKIDSYSQKYDHLNQTISILEEQNAKLKKETSQFNEILSTRQKIINDVKLQYEKANKTVTKKDHLIQKFLNQDQIQEEIEKFHQKNIKRRFLQLINKKGSKVMKIHQFQKKKKEKQQRIQQKRNNSFKVIVFEAFMKNYNKERGLKDLYAKKSLHMLNDFFNEWKIEASISRAESYVQNFVHQSRKTKFVQALCNFSLSKKRNQKILNFIQIRLKKKIFFNGFQKFRDQQKKHRFQSIAKAQKFNNQNLLGQFFQILKLSQSILNNQREQNRKIVKSVIKKKELNLLRNLVRLQKKQEQVFSEQLKINVIKFLESKLLIKTMKNQCQKNSRFRKGFSIALNYRLSKLFKGFKSITTKTINKYKKFRPLVYKAAQQQRLKILITKFRQQNLEEKVQIQNKKLFFESLNKFHLIKTEYSLKQTQLQCFLNFRRSFKAKTNFISELRRLNVLRKAKSKQINLSEHYHMQDLKYKEGHQLNMFTLDQLKQQIANYLNEINCYKVQVQILAQREQFLLDEKQNCLFEMQSREQENLELKAILIENEKKMNELQKKYQKSLDMYAAAMGEVDQKTVALQRGKSSFLYDTIAGTRSHKTFRRENNETTFTSLKR